MLDDLRRDQAPAATPARKPRNRHAPHTLAGEAPVRPVLDHPVDAVAAPSWNPAHAGVDHLERLLAKIVLLHRNKPLIGGAKNHRILAPPAVRVGVRSLVFDSIQKQALLFELLGD